MTVSDDELIRRYWHLVGHRSELAAPGDFVRLEWALGDLVLYNDEGEVIAFDNVCPHRGTRFFTEDRGSRRAICPYHGWSVRAGEVRVTRRAEFSDADVARATLNRYRTAWCADWLFVGLEPMMSLEQQLDAFAPRMAEMSGDIAGPRDLYKLGFQAPWRASVENALEAYHVNNVHPETLGPMGLCDEADSFAGLNSAYHARIGAARTARGLKGLRRFFDLRADFEGYCTYYLFPFSMISSPFGYSYALQTYFPSGEAGLSRFCTRLYASRAAEGGEGPVEALMTATTKVNHQIFDEDRAICGRISPTFDLAKPDRIYAASEARVQALAETLRGLEAATTPPLRSHASG